MFGVGFTELLVILVVGLLVLGPDKLPGVARTLGKTMGEFKRTMDEVKRELMFPRLDSPYQAPPQTQLTIPPDNTAEKIAEDSVDSLTQAASLASEEPKKGT